MVNVIFDHSKALGSVDCKDHHADEAGVLWDYVEFLILMHCSIAVFEHYTW